ncbi:MAG TPA: efflux RND transporter periplasmic adaptor subunit [Pirellulales bacterium]|nr:efflux RND transporter periplasmic adaptor subunit [Pirellulales bacterium]
MNDQFNRHSRLEHEDAEPIDEGGLRAPPGLTGWRKAWWWFDFIILVKLARLRFIGILAVIGVVITQWDTLLAYYDRFTRPADAATVTSGDVEWFCPMHPSVIRDNGKEKCPICFMPLSKRKKGDTHEEALPPGVVNRVQLSPYRVVLGGVREWKVDFVTLSKQINAVGFIEFNERGVRNVSARVKGRIDTLYVNETGKMVEEGDVLASLYSPELNVTARNLVAAHRAGNQVLAQSARSRLELLGISGDQIDEILNSATANTHLKIRSPISGHVIKKYIVEGQYVNEGTPLYDVADLSTVWIQAQVYEDDISFLPSALTEKPLPSGSPDALRVTATSRAFPNEPFHGNLSFVFPHVDEATRTVTIRCEVENVGHKMRPGTTANVTIEVPPKEIAMLAKAAEGDPERIEKLDNGLVLAVPESSVIDTGKQRIVYRETQPNVFEGVKVELGPRMTDPEGAMFYPVLSGLKAGERVVTTGSFLVDAETRLNPAAGSIYFGGGGSKGGGSSVTTVRPSTPEDPDAEIAAALAGLTSEDRAVALAQKFCPILKNNRLGSMGAPVKLNIAGETVFVCCAGCEEEALADTKATLEKVAALKQTSRGRQ